MRVSATARRTVLLSDRAMLHPAPTPYAQPSSRRASERNSGIAAIYRGRRRVRFRTRRFSRYILKSVSAYNCFYAVKHFTGIVGYVRIKADLLAAKLGKSFRRNGSCKLRERIHAVKFIVKAFPCK